MTFLGAWRIQLGSVTLPLVTRRFDRDFRIQLGYVTLPLETRRFDREMV